MKLVAEDAAINDAIYVLGDQLAADGIDAETFIKVRAPVKSIMLLLCTINVYIHVTAHLC